MGCDVAKLHWRVFITITFFSLMSNKSRGDIYVKLPERWHIAR